MIFLMTIDPTHHIYNIQLIKNVFWWNLFISKFSIAAPRDGTMRGGGADRLEVAAWIMKRRDNQLDKMPKRDATRSNGVMRDRGTGRWEVVVWG
jgi:hypothetical protein